MNSFPAEIASQYMCEMEMLKMKKILITLLVFSLFYFNCSRDKSPYAPDEDENIFAQTDEYTDVISKTIQGQEYQLFSERERPSHSGWDTAPDSILIMSHTFLSDKFGIDYFTAHFNSRSNEIIPIEAKSDSSTEYYVVTLFYKITINDFITKKIVATYHNSLGKIVRHEGVVDLIDNPEMGIPFETSDEKAIDIAKEYGLEEGIYPWHVTFYFYYGDVNRYVWCVRNFITQYSGKNIIIDASNSKIIKESGYSVIID